MPGRDRHAINAGRFAPSPRRGAVCAQPSPEAQLAALTSLASAEIETAMVRDLSASLNDVFGDVCEKALPIYFGPLLGRLYLEGL